METAFNFDQSLLFSQVPGPEPVESGIPLLSDSLLFAPISDSITNETTATADSTSNITINTGENIELQDKEVTLFDGSTLRLQRRTKKIPVLSFDDAESILDMDALHEQVDRRQNTKKERDKLRKKLKCANVSQQVWTDKYRPGNFMQLVSAGNERQYRQILRFLRKWNTILQRQPIVDDDPVDNLGRPLKKVLLVHGPSGSGKTTTVHLLAKQMGYVIQELNAANSMDTVSGVERDSGKRFANAAAALKLRIQNAMTSNMLDLAQMTANSSETNKSALGSKVGANSRPTCLVIDEVDSSINASDIVRVIAEVVAADHRKLFLLRRPIICIANDIYTLSVRSFGPNPMDRLRPLCEVVAFRRPATSRSKTGKVNVSAQRSVKEFLMKVSNTEKLGLDANDVAEVFEVCDGDVRACLNHMQFLGRRLDASIYGNAGKPTGGKDDAVSWYAVVDALFTRDAHLLKDDNACSIFDMMLAGEGKTAVLDKIMRGCFNRYLDVVHLQDDSVTKPAEISDWLYYYDLVNVDNYPSLAPLKFWSMFSAINPRKVAEENSLVPNARNMDFETHDLLKQNRTIVRRIGDLLPISAQLACPTVTHACELVPFLNTILSPEVGSSKTKTALKAYEKIRVEKLAHLVKALDITLETTRDLETKQTSLTFSPSWDSLTIYESDLALLAFPARAKTLYMKRQWLFPLLQAELDAMNSLGVKRSNEMPQESKKKRSRVASSVDYFKNQYELLTQEKPKMNHMMLRIWVKYHEGFSNAVRKNIGWGDLWLP